MNKSIGGGRRPDRAGRGLVRATGQHPRAEVTMMDRGTGRRTADPMATKARIASDRRSSPTSRPLEHVKEATGRRGFRHRLRRDRKPRARWKAPSATSRTAGTLVLVSIITENITFSDPEFHKREMTVLGSRNALRADFERVIAAVENSSVPWRPSLSHRTTLHPARSADLAALDHGKAGTGKGTGGDWMTRDGHRIRTRRPFEGEKDIVTLRRTCGPSGHPVASGMEKISYAGYRFPPEIIPRELHRRDGHTRHDAQASRFSAGHARRYDQGLWCANAGDRHHKALGNLTRMSAVRTAFQISGAVLSWIRKLAEPELTLF